MDPHRQFTVEKSDAGTRLDKFLTAKLPSISRSQIQKLIKAGRATMNGKSVSVHHFLKAGDVVIVHDPSPHPLPATVRGKGGHRPGEGPTIVYEDDEMLVVEKPAGMLVHPAKAGQKESNTLTAWLLSRYPDFREVGFNPERPGIVHRLDRDVSGLMVIAKTKTAHDHLLAQFKNRRVEKTYAAIVYGTPTKHAGVITLPIGRAASGKFVAHPQRGGTAVHENDRDAHTQYRLVQAYDRYSLLEITIATGRPHQIRAHLAAIGCPIVGDAEYGPRKPFHHTGKRRIKTVAIPRLLLHVTGLTFTGLDGKLHSFTSPVPAIFNDFLNH